MKGLMGCHKNFNIVNQWNPQGQIKVVFLLGLLVDLNKMPYADVE